MLYAVGSPLPEYRIRAARIGGDTANLICEDAHARRHGYRAGLVPGVTLYAYMSRSLVEFMGIDWLQRGSVDLTLHQPVHDGEELRVCGHVASIGKEGAVCVECRTENPQGIICSTGVARVPSAPPEPEPTIADYPAGQHRLKRAITLESLTPGDLLTPVTSEFDRKTHWEYCEKAVRDHLPIYQQLAHPGWLLSQADKLFAANYDLPPWIHVSSSVQNFRAQEQEGIVETRGRIVEKFEVRGNHFVSLDVAIFAGPRCLATVRHTAIFRIAPRVA
jgi:hypothetical protein